VVDVPHEPFLSHVKEANAGIYAHRLAK